MGDREYASWVAGKGRTCKSSYAVLEEITETLGFSDSEVRILFRLIGKTDFSMLHFVIGDLEIGFDHNREENNLCIALSYKSGTTTKERSYCYNLALLDKLTQKHSVGGS